MIAVPGEILDLTLKLSFLPTGTYLGLRHEVTVWSLVRILTLQPQLFGLLLQPLLLLLAAGVHLALGTEVGLGHPGGQHGEQPQQEGEDGGEEEAPPFPLIQTLLVVNERSALPSQPVSNVTECLLTYVWSEGLHTTHDFHL